jgi:hypothetical protein
LQFTALFGKELNQMQATADLVRYFIPDYRRFCYKPTFMFPRRSEPAASLDGMQVA